MKNEMEDLIIQTEILLQAYVTAKKELGVVHGFYANVTEFPLVENTKETLRAAKRALKSNHSN